MASVNKVIIVGRLGQDPDIRVFQNGDKIANLSIATSERWTDKTTGEPQEKTEWHRVVLLGKVAGVAEQYLKKGSQVYIEGSLHTRKYTGQDGIERYTTEIKSYAIQMLGSPQNSGQSSYNDGYAPQGQAYAPQQTSQGYQPPQQPTQGRRYATTPDGQPIAPPPTDVPNDDMPF